MYHTPTLRIPYFSAACAAVNTEVIADVLQLIFSAACAAVNKSALDGINGFTFSAACAAVNET